MGIPTVFCALLVKSRLEGAAFGKLATIGRQSLTVPLNELRSFAAQLGVDVADWDKLTAGGYADAFLTDCMGAESLTSFDYSAYQGIDVVHDFNWPLDSRFHRAFDALIDGGSIEHIFDVRQVFENYMSMVRPGGHVFIHTPANNLLGHGFYQFSPELFYRVFCPENGFEIVDVCLTESPLSMGEASRRQRCFKTRDPRDIGKRVRFVNDRPVMCYVHARRLEAKPVFAAMPMQSDYTVKWEAHRAEAAVAETGEGSSHAEAAQENRPFRYLSLWQELRRSLAQRRKHSFRNRKFFLPLDL